MRWNQSSKEKWRESSKEKTLSTKTLRWEHIRMQLFGWVCRGICVCVCVCLMAQLHFDSHWFVYLSELWQKNKKMVPSN